MNEFEKLGVNAKTAAHLAELGLANPTPIQTQSIPHVLEGRDLLGLAQTGTGKTAAFGLPLLQLVRKIDQKPAPKTVTALILVPTRELANQIVEALRSFAGSSPVKINVVVGGKSINVQSERLAKGTSILVATPGRLIDLLDRRAVDLSQTRYLVLDEADQMLDMGFVHALRKIAPKLRSDRQTLLFSATMPKQMSELANTYLTNPVRVQVAPPGRTADKINQSVHFIAQTTKADALIEALDTHRDELAIVFARTKHGAERLKKRLVAEGFGAESIHGNKSQGQRDRALDAFRAGEARVLVATDVAARGIDIPQVRHVYNFELPNVPENYVHRIGRTARAGAAGAAVSFCAPAEMGELKAIEKLLGQSIRVAFGRPWETLPDPKNTPKPPQRRRRPSRGRGGPRRKAA